MASQNVYKPFTKGIYTRSASPDLTPPRTTRVGRMIGFNQTAINTYTAYSVDPGKTARLCYFVITQNNVADMTLTIDNQDVLFIPATVAVSSAPVINCPYEMGVEVLNNIKIRISGGPGPVRISMLVVEDLVVNN